MKWDHLIEIVADEPVFTTGFLLVGTVSQNDVQRQLSRWVKAGKIIQLRRGVYMLAPPYRRIEAHPFLLANAVKRASFVTLQSALIYWNMIPEHAPNVTSITSGRPEKVAFDQGLFIYRHVNAALFGGYTQVEVAPRQKVFLATPEKCLLDLVYLTPRGESRAYLEELRLQNLDRIDRNRLMDLAKIANSAKLMRAAGRITRLCEREG